MLTDTGERMLPESSSLVVFWEHVYRYAFALPFARGKTVLDIACGAGYGTAALGRAGAARVIGVDISEAACQHARSIYGIEAMVGDASAIPLADDSVNLVVSFETIEHVPKPATFLQECRRVLKPGGRIILSTPNRDIYRKLCPENQFHCSEMDFTQLAHACELQFHSIRFFTQRPFFTPWWSPRALAADYWSHNPNHIVNCTIRWSRRLLFRSTSRARTAHYRVAPVEAILDRRRVLFDCFNPYQVRPLSRLAPEEPVYYLATGLKA